MKRPNLPQGFILRGDSSLFSGRGPGAAVFLFFATFLLYAPGLNSFFVGDDFDFLNVIGRFDGLGEVLRFGFWGEWEPLWYWTWYVDLHLWGHHPFGFHVNNTLWMALLVISLFGVVRRVWPESPIPAWTVALLFLTYPLHDEAVTYLAARGHPISASLAVLALWLYAEFRLSDTGNGLRRMAALAGALLVAFLAPLAKETALVLPIWIGVLEWTVLRADRPAAKAFRTGLGAGALFLVPAVATLVLRGIVIGLNSRKIRGLAGNPLELFDDLFGYLPSYALLGGLPVPLGFIDYPTLDALRVVGWLLLAGVLAGAGVALYVALFQRPARSPAAGLYLLGFVIAATSLGPVFWADLPLRRRYLFTPSVGIVLMATTALHAAYLRYPRMVRAGVGVLLLVGALGTAYRNDLYRRSGAVARDLLEATRGAPLTEPAARGEEDAPVITLVTLPRMYGGDFLSGAYLFHHTDLRSAFWVFGVPQPAITYALQAYHAEDYTADAVFESPTELRLTVSFRGTAAFRLAVDRDLEEDARGSLVLASLERVDEEALTLIYRVRIDPEFGSDPRNELWLYSESSFERLMPAP